MKKQNQTKPSLKLTTNTIRTLEVDQLTGAAGGATLYMCTVAIDVSQNCPGRTR